MANQDFTEDDSLSELTQIAEMRHQIAPRPPRRSSSGGLILALCMVLLLGAGLAVAVIVVVQGSGTKLIVSHEPATTPVRELHRPPVVTRLARSPTAASMPAPAGVAYVEAVQTGFVRLKRAGVGTPGGAARGIFDMGDEAPPASSEIVLAVVLTIAGDAELSATYNSYNYSGRASLRDKSGRLITNRELSAFEPVIHAAATTTIQQGRRVSDTLIFTPSTMTTEYELILPGQNLGATTPLVVKLPVDLPK